MDSDLLVINADLPLVRPNTLRPFLKYHQRQANALTFLTADLENPTGFGRIIPLEDGIIRIVEEKDATPAQKTVKESNLGIYLFRIRDLFQNLSKISNRNKKDEYYLTDIIEIMTRQGKKVSAFKTALMEEFVGVNDRYELAGAVQTLRLRKIKKLAESGVTITDPASTWIDESVKIGKDTVLYPSVCLEGSTKVGEGCTVYPFVHLIDVEAGDGVRILSSTMVESSKIEDGARVGPFSRIRPKTVIRKGARVGNFVEMKSTRFGRGSKAGHLSYIGDSEIGDRVNIGAGTITCNYDGVHKHKTVIEEGVFIGSGTELVAPVKIGKKAYVGAGSTITKDVAPGALAVARGRQMEKRGWARRKKKK
jgi:bifunctional UDP-N-acetylglucosamine pyrophosphorylase/glucosamine-1-phosphate N-acetyltransferase